MICIVQVYVYQIGNGCSVRIGKGYSVDMPLDRRSCVYFDVVNTVSDVNKVVKIIRKLPSFYRNKERSLELLYLYVKKIKNK
jgi:hypothetical protein